MMGACSYHIRQCGFGTGNLRDLEYHCKVIYVRLTSPTQSGGDSGAPVFPFLKVHNFTKIILNSEMSMK